MADRLDADEDGTLRRLHFFEQMGALLSPAVAELMAKLRGRDRRAEIRAPQDSLDHPERRARRSR